MKQSPSVKQEESSNEEAKHNTNSVKSEPDRAGGYGRGMEDQKGPQRMTNGYQHGGETKNGPLPPAPSPQRHANGVAFAETPKEQRYSNGAEMYQSQPRPYSPTSPQGGAFQIGLRPAAPGDRPVRHLHLPDIDEQHRAQSPSKKPGYCVDELCSCGMHKCVPSRPPLPFEGDSVYRQEYGPKPLAPPVPPPEVKLPPSLPFDADSSYRTEYGPKPLPPAPKPVEVKRPPSLPFSGESAYRQDYGPKPLPPPLKPAEVKLPPSLPFDADSSYRSEYGPKPLPKPQPPAQMKLPPSLPFEGSTLYRDEFTAKPLPQPQIPAAVKLPPSLPFDANSAYRTEYVPKASQICQVTRLPAYPQAPYPGSHVFWDPVEKQWY